MLDNPGKFLRSDGDGSREEFRDVVAAEELAVVLRVVLRQLEGLAEMPFSIEVGYIRTGEVTIDTATGEDHPALIAGPAMPALHLGRIDFTDGINTFG